MKYSILILITTIMLSAPLHAAKMRIAVMNFVVKGVTKAIAENVAELIRGEMINTGKYTVIERAQMNRILKEQGLQRTGCTDISCAVEIGKILSARKILIGTVMKLGGMIVITGRIVDVKSGAGEFSEKQSAESERGLYNAVSIFTKKLTSRIEGGEYYEETAPAVQAQSDSKGNVYDSWFMAMEYNFGLTGYEEGAGGVFMIGMNFSNSYGSIFHFGGRLGALAGFGPDYELDLLGEQPYDPSDPLSNISSEYERGYSYAGEVAGVFAELTMGVNLRVGSGFFGFKLFGGLGIFKGVMTSYTYGAIDPIMLSILFDPYYDPYDPYYSLLTSGNFNEEDISYTTLYLSLGAGIPLGRGSRFAGPIFQIMILPTPDEIDEGAIVMVMLGFKHAW